MSKIKYYIGRLKEANFDSLKWAINEVHKRSGISRIIIFFDMVFCSFKYLAGYMDYYYYYFESADAQTRKSFITRGINNSYIKKLNDPKYGEIFDDKIKFNEVFKDYIKRDFLDLRETSLEDFQKFVKLHPIIILKPINLQCGKNIEKITITKEMNLEDIYENAIKNEQYLIEECVLQHDKLNELFPYSVNTLRIVTARVNKKTTILFRAIRIGSGKNVVDNFNHGGMYSIINESGVITKPAIDKKSNIYTEHPVTKTRITGFTIPYFKEAIKLCEKASQKIPQVGLVGWDIAITQYGPLLIEGNNFPGYDIYQSRIHLDENGHGLRPLFDKVIFAKPEKKKF